MSISKKPRKIWTLEDYLAQDPKLVKELTIPVLSFKYTGSALGQVEDADTWQYEEVMLKVASQKRYEGTFLKLWQSRHKERKFQLTVQRFTWLGEIRGFNSAELDLSGDTELEGIEIVRATPKKITLDEASKISREKVCMILERSGNALIRPHVYIDNESLQH